MEAKLLLDAGKQRFYKLPKKITRYGKNESIEQLIKNSYKELPENILEQIKDGVDIICVSDAHTHIERLVFPAFKIDGQLKFLTCDIDGYLTFMIDGGDKKLVYPDEVYIRHLLMINK